MAALDVVGVAEVSELLGVSKSRVRQLARNRPHGFPQVAAQLAAGPIWQRADVVRWKRHWPRRPGRPVGQKGAASGSSQGIAPLIDALRTGLATVPGVEEAFLFGSFAKGSPGPESDIDVLVVGKPDWRAVTMAAEPIEREWGRDLHVTAMRRSHFEERRAAGNGFVGAVLLGPHLPILDRRP
jgi:predicted nucleotidyltransferase